MSSPRRGGDKRTSAGAGLGDDDESRARGASPDPWQGAGNLSFGSTPAPYWFAFDPPHPWAALEERAHSPGFPQPPNEPFPWNMPPVLSERPFGGGPAPAAVPLMPPWGPPREPPFVGFVRAVTGAPSKGNTGEPGGVFPAGGGRSVPVVAPCLPLVRRVGQRAAASKSNFLASPLSFHAALALVAAGARGDTQRELLAFLGSSDSLHELHRAPATSLLGTLRELPQTSFACGVWVDRRRALVPEFTDTAVSRYAAVAEAVDFVSEPEAARRRVNAFVGEATRGLITDVVPPGSVGSSTVLVLANALYFKGTWARPFDPWMTFAAPFHLSGGGTVRAPFMTSIQFKEQVVAVFPGFKALKLPYKNDGGAREAALFYMLLLLPDGEALEIGDLYDRAVSTPGFIGEHTPVEEVPVGRFMVPKFKFTFEFEASADMQHLGVARAFRGGDFSGMVTGGDGLFISGVYHKGTIEVDELGTVAAAATAVVVQQCARVGPPPVDFVADRPFLFAIVEERSGVVLFLGHVVNPPAE